ncbi:zinc finger protein 280C isoform X1 [Oncorhynchus tshawytscha]|uniref:C2H2-type domain-containing protein n=1 Tax=Oncorhynchus tshawytscha TaxID=74940 RepID=A0A8C8EUX2_ONCTS|nr:zinc finger protein 280C isoform X1 [Oncorhynchus tshawytscha]XP_024274683.1 zinc finger protein 280C isoform X1 [Oncorhynchus tshawytscha]XP_024274684.1 zinc finger protein 280C isoform X1 [Oncorhynchus tshawytscha]XP_024274685.1 zinc finger protein 280C isoform X1 [Oncorhynchus tshawytscha]XP_042177004.1 zinc finger protein 280C isoform X1 [Oncorhynchus tshawytscha]
MSELFMECEEEELEPWQRQTPEVNLLGDGKHDDDDDDEPIFVGELSTSKGTINTRPTNNQRNVKTTPVQSGGVGRPRAPRMTMTNSSPQAHLTQGPVPQNIIIPGKGLNNAPRPLTAVPPQPIIINNQGYIMTTPQLPANSAFLASLGKQYPPGTSFTVVPAGQQHILQQVTPGKPLPGVIHRPQVHMIHNNVVTLSNVQGPAALSSQPNRSNSTNLQIVSPVIQAKGNSWDYGKRGLPQDQNSTAKKAKQDMGSSHAQEILENGARFCKKCPKCKFDFYQQVVMKDHMVKCCPHLLECVFPSTPKSTYLFASKRIMLVTDFYYGRFEGDKPKLQQQKTPFTYKCQSCLKVLKNNVRFMNHMKHHLELEKQNSESWESHTTCQHCYRQYSTPFQLQCHVESAHSMVESSTNCKICELAFESEQVLLEHMKDNHKPGEMPYVCQVCNYRSSFFTDVDTHFRTVHENTKDLLCPFCLKVLKSGHVYMQHYMKHQKKGINRCGKCRLNFLTYKERVDHKTQHHKTFQKPKALEGLPPGTKVTIRASLTGPSPSSARAADKSSVSVIPEVPGMKGAMKAANVKAQSSTSTTQGSSGGKGKGAVSKKLLKQQKNNHVLQSLSIGDRRHTCIECYSEIHDFYSHYPMVAICGACKYRTSCKTSFGNHMIRFHSAISKERFRKMRKIPVVLRNLTLVCLNCDFLADAHGTDLMSKHLIDRPHHICKVILEKGEGGAVDDGIRGNKQGISALMFPDIQNAETATVSGAFDQFHSVPRLVETSNVLYITPAAERRDGPEVMHVQTQESGRGAVILLDNDDAAVNQLGEAEVQGLPHISTVDQSQGVTQATELETPMESSVEEDQSLQSGPMDRETTIGNSVEGEWREEQSLQSGLMESETPMESSVEGEQREERALQSATRSRTSSVACELDGETVRLHESLSKPESVSFDDSKVSASLETIPFKVVDQAVKDIVEAKDISSSQSPADVLHQRADDKDIPSSPKTLKGSASSE